MAIKIGNLDNEKGKAKIGNEFKNSEIDSETMDIEVGDISNSEGDLDVGNRGEGVKARKSWVWALIAIASALTAYFGYRYSGETTEPIELFAPKEVAPIIDESFEESEENVIIEPGDIADDSLKQE